MLIITAEGNGFSQLLYTLMPLLITL